jgi:hypothetical protein
MQPNGEASVNITYESVNSTTPLYARHGRWTLQNQDIQTHQVYLGSPDVTERATLTINNVAARISFSPWPAEASYYDGGFRYSVIDVSGRSFLHLSTNGHRYWPAHVEVVVEPNSDLALTQYVGDFSHLAIVGPGTVSNIYSAIVQSAHEVVGAAVIGQGLWELGGDRSELRFMSSVGEGQIVQVDGFYAKLIVDNTRSFSAALQLSNFYGGEIELKGYAVSSADFTNHTLTLHGADGTSKALRFFSGAETFEIGRTVDGVVIEAGLDGITTPGAIEIFEHTLV